ncbi:hypothetical protein Trco_002915 [Trichoderma cornu-damae]|uniref:Uncharacterized protein n=1 Tax=Trichoderma cornu-damae TaxID=654480 RepID=A0A9P8QQR4_9HYPO|nr:hypothetical protein Trco_002915 [Trichoderma cornu-damae]
MVSLWYGYSQVDDGSAKLDVLLGLGDTAETKDADNAINTARLNPAVPGRRIINSFNTDRDDLVDVIYANVLDTLFERFGGNGIRFHAINLGDVAAGGFSVAKTLCVVCVAGIVTKASKNICPHAASSANLHHGAVYGSADDFVMNDAALDTTTKEGKDMLLSGGLYIWPDGSPEGAEQSLTESGE